MNQPLKELLQQKINTKTKPLGALGILESVALQAGLIQDTATPAITSPAIVVFAADHGIAATGLVNPYPQAVTAQMVLNFIGKGAAINVFTKQHHIQLLVVDAGVKTQFNDIPPGTGLIDAKQGPGTKDYLQEEAMSMEQVNNAILKGREIVHQLAMKSCNCIGFGEMGIGNTSSASLIMSAVTGMPLEECIGRGTGVNDEQLAIKMKTLQIVYLKHQLERFGNEPLQLLSRIGGFEIAMMVGAYLQAFDDKMIIVVDGFITTAALLLARKIQPVILQNCIFAHTSGEQGHTAMLEFLEAAPLLHLGMRLGEGTGAALAIPLIQSAVAFLNEMASFESAGVSTQ